MKTRVWKVLMFIHDCPGYDDEGQPIPFLKKKELEKELRSAGPQCYGLGVNALEITHIGHIESPPTSSRSKSVMKPLELKMRKPRNDKGVKRGSYKNKETK